MTLIMMMTVVMMAAVPAVDCNNHDTYDIESWQQKIDAGYH